jgi:hypothetical protein
MSIIKSLSDFSPLNEDNMAGLANAHPWQEIERMVTVMVAGTPIQLTGNLFKTGSSIIDTNSTPFQDAIGVFKKLKEAGYRGTLIIRGSASKVGFEKGFDNMALAQKRADNFWKAVQKWFKENAGQGLQIQFGFEIKPEAVVGEATVPNSKEALAEQCVYLIWVGEDKKEDRLKYDLVQPIDNTAVAVKPVPIKVPVVLPEEERGTGSYTRCGCCGRDFTDNDKKGWVMDRYKWALNELKNGWLRSKPGTTVWEWLTNMSKK